MKPVTAKSTDSQNKEYTPMSETTRRRSESLPHPPPDVICQTLGVSGVTIDWLAGDGSDRCYYRIRSSELSESYVLMQLSEEDAKLLNEDGYDWTHISNLLSGFGISVPKLKASLPKFAALIIDDYGNEMLEGLIHSAGKLGLSIETLYQPAIDVVEQFLRIPREDNAIWCRRSFDRERLEWELRFFNQKYIEKVLGLSFSSSQKSAYESDCRALARAVSEQSRFFVHRDFHSRNIMVKNNKYAVIDFQDARLGPPSYDLVSLMFDSYVPIAQKTRIQLTEDALNKFHASGLISSDDVNLWPAVLLQRQLKAIGSFGYLTVEKSRGEYLKYVPSALNTIDFEKIRDDRWPFLSDTLLKMIRQNLGLIDTDI